MIAADKPVQRPPHAKLLVVDSCRHISHAADVVPDRKSTRLNSSHLVISYAVFCLKKKNNTHNRAYFTLYQSIHYSFFITFQNQQDNASLLSFDYMPAHHSRSTH